jgi:hypothetical protein
MCNHKGCLAQLVERKALNLKVVGSSPTVRVQYFLSLSLICFFIVQIFSFMPLICPCVQYFLSLSLICFFYCPDFFVVAADLSVQIYFSSRFFCF